MPGGSSITGSRPVALVTGATRRVGLASARALAGAGLDIIISSRRDDAGARAAAVEIGALGVVGHIETLDLGDLASLEEAARRLARSLPRLDVLVHNASTYERTPLDALTPDALLTAFCVNAGSPLLLSRVLASLLARSSLPGGGSIVAMCDVHALGEHGLPRRRDFAAYAMSKAALAEMVRTLARELAPGVRVNGIALGVAAWPEQGHESDPAAQTAYLKNVPLARAGTPEEAAEAVRWMALDATYVTGQILRVDGGRSMV